MGSGGDPEVAYWFRIYSERKAFAKMGVVTDGELQLDDEAEWLLAIENEILSVGEKLREHERKVKGRGKS